MAHKCFISYKKEDKYYREEIDKLFDDRDVINKGLDTVINSEDGDYIMKKIRDDYLKDSTVTLFLIGQHSSENEGVDYLGQDKNYFIKKELQSSLYNRQGNTRNGILGVVIPSMYDSIYKGEYTCQSCGKSHNHVAINDNTVIKEFSENYYLKPHSGCAWSEDERYCVLVKWDDFIINPEKYINKAYEKRDSDLSDKVHVNINRGNTYKIFQRIERAKNGYQNKTKSTRV